MIAVAGDSDLDQLVPLLDAELHEIRPAQCLEILAGHLRAVQQRLSFVARRVDHAGPPMAEVLAEAAAELSPACVAPGVADAEARVEPAEASGFAVADDADADWVHGSN